MVAHDTLQVFLLDHAWTFTPASARGDLEADPALCGRLCDMLAITVPPYSEIEQAAAAPAGQSDDEEETADADVAPATPEDAEPAALAAADLTTAELELDDCGVTSVAALRLADRCPNLRTLSLWGNAVTDPADVVAGVTGLSELRALWLNGNPVAKRRDEYAAAVRAVCPHLEILDSKFLNGCVIVVVWFFE
jgi:tubulin--tyrosine ligase-like protein 12